MSQYHQFTETVEFSSNYHFYRSNAPPSPPVHTPKAPLGFYYLNAPQKWWNQRTTNYNYKLARKQKENKKEKPRETRINLFFLASQQGKYNKRPGQMLSHCHTITLSRCHAVTLSNTLLRIRNGKLVDSHWSARAVVPKYWHVVVE